MKSRAFQRRGHRPAHGASEQHPPANTAPEGSVGMQRSPGLAGWAQYLGAGGLEVK